LSETIPPKTTLAHYCIISKIGAGGMGEVYLAQDTKLDRKVAVKILLPGLASNQDRMRRFVQEAKAAAALNHPNIAHIYEIGTCAAGPGKNLVQFIAMEFIDGLTLREELGRGERQLPDTIEIAGQIAAALSAAHSAGIVHRDLKPENVMIRRDGIVKVLDFGLAKLTEPAKPQGVDSEAPTQAVIHTEPGIVMGTALYMSPEQARGLQVDERTDIFSLGVVIYELVAGHLPFAGANTNEIWSSILSEREPQPLARYAREVPVELERIVSKALRKNRDERYQTIKDMLVDLKSLKQEVEFEKKLGRSLPRAEPSSSPQFAKTTVSRAPVVNNEDQPATLRAATTSLPTNYFARHKRRAGVAAMVLLMALVGVYWSQAHRRGKETPIGSIAVMPFENVSHDQNTEYLSDGVTESLINSLSQLSQIRVIARNSVFNYKNQTLDLQQVARKLEVQAILTGRVFVKGDTLDVRVELTDVANNTQLWGDHYVRAAADIFTVQDEIAHQVTEKLRVRLTGGQLEQVNKRYTENPDAYQLFLQGRHYLNQSSEEMLKRAVLFFDQAIALDPRYALAYAARGESFFYMGDLNLSMNESMARAKQELTKALSIDESLVEARTTQANIEYQYDWDFARAEADLKQVVASNPNYAEAHHSYAFYLALTGKPSAAASELKLAQQLDPINPAIVVDETLPYFSARQYDQAIAQARQGVALFPDFFLSHMTLGGALIEKGDISEGIQELEKAKAIESTPLPISNLGYAYAKAGRKEDARKLISELKEQAKSRYVAAYSLAVIYAGLNEKDEAFAWLEKAYQARSYWVIWIKVDPKMDNLRSDPRFLNLMGRIGLPL
jgi:serine/threonine-protein kinase